LFALAASTVLVVSVAWAYVTSGGTGTGAAPVGALAAPTGVSGAPSGTDVVVTWTGVTAPGIGPLSYYVTRTPVPGATGVDVCGSPTAPLPSLPTTCTDTGAPAGTSTYEVTALFRTWTATSAPSGDVEVGRPTTTSLGLSASTVPYGAEATVTFSATVSSAAGGVPTGTVTVVAGDATLCSITLPGTACSSGATALGASGTAHEVTASYAGDGAYSGSTAPDAGLTVTPDTTSASVTATPDTVTVGFEDSAVLAATVTTTEGEALPSSESVTIGAGTTSCVAVLAPSAGGGHGTCRIGASSLDVSGTPYAVSASYPGDADLSGSLATAATGLSVVAAPTVTTTSLADATLTETGYLQVLAVDGGSPPVTWSVVGGNLPAGLALDPESGTVSGDVGPDAVTATFTVDALDGSGAVARATLTITVDDAPVITTGSLDPAVAAEAGYTQTLTATGGAPDLTWSIAIGVLPVGLALDPDTGVISGDVAPAATTETFVVAVTDANGIVGSEELTLPVTTAFVQQYTAARASGNHASLTAVLLAPVAAGDTLVLSLAQPCTTSTGTPTASPVTGATWDGAGFTEAVATGCTADGDAELWYLVGTGSATGTSATTVTVTLATAATVPFLDVVEYRGVGRFDPAPGASRAETGSTSSVSPGPATPSSPGELVVTSAFLGRATPSTLSTQLYPFALLNQTSPDEGFGAYLVDPVTSPLTYTFAQSAPAAWSAVIGAFSLAP